MRIGIEKTAFSATDICVSRGGKRLLWNVSLSVVPGEITAVLGPNGAGKSTLLKVMSGEIIPDSGSVCLNGKILESMSPLEIAKTRAVLPQHSDLSFPFLAYEVVLMGREPHSSGVESEYDHWVVWKAMQAVDILHLAQKNYHLLSGGERQRVHLARVLAQVWPRENDGVKFLLLDEPTSNLDLAHQYALLQSARELAQCGLGIMVILHDLNLVAQFSDQVLLLCGGAQKVFGTPEEVLQTDVIESVFEIPMDVISHPANGRKIFMPRNPEGNSFGRDNYFEQ